MHKMCMLVQSSTIDLYNVNSMICFSIYKIFKVLNFVSFFW